MKCLATRLLASLFRAIKSKQMTKNIRRIVILRHAKVILDNDIKVAASEIGEWLRIYDRARLNLRKEHLEQLQSLASGTVFSSQLSRSIRTAEGLGFGDFSSAEVFNEAELPVLPLSFPRIRGSRLASVLRGVWFSGLSIGCESRDYFSNIRMKQAAAELEDATDHNGSCVLVGHGLTNRYVGKHLISNGWRLEGKFSEDHLHPNHFLRS